MLIDRIRYIRDAYKPVFVEMLDENDHRMGFYAQPQGLLVWEGGFPNRTSDSLLTWHGVVRELDTLIETGQLIAKLKAPAPKKKRKPAETENGQLSFLEAEYEPAPESMGGMDLRNPEEQEQAILVAAADAVGMEPANNTPPKRITYPEPIEDDGTHITEEEINHALARGSSIYHGKLRIYQQFQRNASAKENADFLKNEYGWGGGTWTFLDGTSGSLDYEPKQFKISYGGYSSSASYVKKMKWMEVEQRIRYLISTNRYLNEKELAYYPEWSKVQELRKDNDRLYRALNDAAFRLRFIYDIPAAELFSPEDAEYIGRDSDRYSDRLFLRSLEDKDFIQRITEKMSVYTEDNKWADGERVRIVRQLLEYLGEQISAEKTADKTQNEEPIEPEQVEISQAPGEQEITDTDPQSSFVDQVMADVERIAAEEPPHEAESINYTAPYHGTAPTTPKARCAANIKAIETLQAIEQRQAKGGGAATPEEQTVLAAYSGWGGLPEAFDQDNSSWSSEFAQIQNLLTEQEYLAARSTVLTAYYTPPAIIHPIYQTLERFGVKGGNILEPSMGVGGFFAHKPNSFDLTNAKLYGVELDNLTGRIARQLYQKAKIQITGYEKAVLPDSFFDCVVGNVPFGDFPVNDPAYNRLHFKIHDYFLAKSIDRLRTGGIMAIITTSGTMDKKSEDVRKYLAARCDLIGAVRLPNNAFSGTKVMADVLFLQKRDTVQERDVPWLHIGESADGIAMNRYFIDHPEMVCGEMKIVSGPYGPTPTCVPFDVEEEFDHFGRSALENQLEKAMAHLEATLTPIEVSLEEDEPDAGIIEADPEVRNFSYTIKDDKIYYRENSIMREVRPNATSDRRIRSMIAMRDTVRELIQAQLDDMPDTEIQRLQHRLNQQYDTFSEKFGLINSKTAALSFQEDSSYFLLCSLENLDDHGNFKSKSDMFTKRTIRAKAVIDHVDTASDALAMSIGDRACVDMGYMCSLTGKNEETIVEELQGVIFKDPMQNTEGEPTRYITADEYLSGNVRQKLSMARIFAEKDPSYRINVKALEQVQPKDLDASEISVRLGATWIGTEDIEDFICDMADLMPWERNRIKVQYSSYTGSWYIGGKGSVRDNVKINTTYGTERANLFYILERSLNLQAIKIFDTVHGPNGDERVFNSRETQRAQEKQRQIEEAFKNWIFKDQDRRLRLVKYYNENFNSIRPREYDGSHIQFVGMNPEITLRPHQRNAIAHILYGFNTLLAHVVGAGKTYEMVAAAMEKKRLGLCSKTLICVPNHLTEQFAAEALQLYPNANILVARKKDFETSKRKKFGAKIATGNYDIIVMGHSQFERIALSFERQSEHLRKQIDDIVWAVEEAKSQNGQHFTVVQMERMRKQLEARLERLNKQERKDDVITFEELGIDSLMIDEADLFKNLMCVTKMHNVAGISTTESQRASDLYAKCQYLDKITGGRGVVFATGTPISNSMTELYTMMRYLQGHLLEEKGLSMFDSWAAAFGETISAIELAPEGTGYRMKTRFAKFYNLPELMAMFRECADIQTADMLKLPVPALIGGKRTTVVIKPSDYQKDMVAALSERADAVRNREVEPTEDNMLKITNDGRKLALDQRLMDPEIPEAVNSKVNACVENVFRIWQESAEQKSAQLIFSDLSTPASKRPLQTEQKEDGTFEVVPDEFTDVYHDIRAKLVAMGVPDEEIAFIHEANTDARKAELFAKVRSGSVRILLGSTSKMGAGTNVQKKLIALHHLDVPWRPRDIEQREGRILRQGNENPEVSIFQYVTEGTFDAYSWQLIETKQKFISQIMTSKSPARTCEDMDDAVLSYAEIKALAVGNPLIKEKMDLDLAVSRLLNLQSAYQSQHYKLEDDLTLRYPAQIQKAKSLIENYGVDIQTRDANTRKDEDGSVIFEIELRGITYDKREDAGKVLLGLVGEAIHAEEPVSLGHYRGFEIKVEYDLFFKRFTALLVGASSHSVELGSDTVGNMTRMNNALSGLEGMVVGLQEALKKTEKQVESAKEELAQPFEHEQELKQKQERLATLNILLGMDKKDKVLDNSPEPPTGSPRRHTGRSAR